MHSFDIKDASNLVGLAKFTNNDHVTGIDVIGHSVIAISIDIV